MENINNWEKFLELNSETWRNAKDKASSYKQYDLAMRFKNKQDETEQNEMDEYHIKLGNLLDDVDGFTVYFYSTEEQWGDRVDFPEYIEYVVIQKIENIQLFNINADSHGNVAISSYDYVSLIIKSFKPDNENMWKFTSKKEALRFIDIINKMGEIYDKYTRKNDYSAVKFLPTKDGVRNFYDTNLEKLYKKQQIKLKKKEFNL